MATATTASNGFPVGWIFLIALLLMGLMALIGVGRGPRADECEYMGCHSPIAYKLTKGGNVGFYCTTHALVKVKQGWKIVSNTQ